MGRTGLVVLLVAGGCWLSGDDSVEGEWVGDFEAEGLLLEDSCGDAIDAPDPLEIEFTLSIDDETEGRAYLDLSGAGDFTGIVDQEEYTFQITQSWTVFEPIPSVGYDGCYVTQRDVLTVLLDEETSAATLTGTQTTEIDPIEGSDCSPAIVAAGGTFLTLPCRVDYVLTGNAI